MTFISNYKLNQDNRIPLYEKKDKFLLLLKQFSPPRDLVKLLNSIDEMNIDLSKDYTKVHNFLDILNEGAFIKQLSQEDKKTIWYFLLNKLSVNEDIVRNYLLLWYWIVILFRNYWDFVEIEQIKKISKKKYLIREASFVVSEFFRRNNLPNNYRDIIFVDMKQKNEKDVVSAWLNTDWLSFIVNNELVFKKFISFLIDVDNYTTIVELLRQRGTSYSKKNEEEEVFVMSLLPKLSNNQRLGFEKIILMIIDKYFETYTSNNTKEWQINDVLQSSLFQKTLNHLTKNSKSFFNDILDCINKKDRFLHWVINNVIIYSIQPSTVENFVKHFISEKWIFLDIYYWVKNSDRKNKDQLLSELEKFGQNWIIENNEINKRTKKNEKVRIEKENQEIRKEIEDRILWIESWKVKIDQRLLYLYDKNQEVFLKEEKKIIISQIHTILCDGDIFDIKGKAEVHYDKENKNSFSRPNYMSYWTIERCYELGKKLKIDIIQYKTKFIHYLPFEFNSKFFDDIVLFNKDEFTYIVEVYSPKRDKKDDLRVFHPFTFFLIVKKFGEELAKKYPDLFSQAIWNLKEFLKLDDEKLGLWSKKEILYLFQNFVDKEFYTNELLEILWENNLEQYNYFNDLLSWNIKSENDANKYSLWVVVNDILCSRFNDDASIKWRLKQLQNITIQLKCSTNWWTYAKGISFLRREIEWRHKDERKFIDALENIRYPNYEDEVIKILKYSFLVAEKKVENLVVSYLQSFAFEYYKNIPDTSKIEILLNIKEKLKWIKNSNNFLSVYFPKYLWELNKQELEVFSTKDSYNELLIKYWKAVDHIKQLESKFSNVGFKNILFVEGKTDKVYLEQAYQEIYWTNIKNFRILVSWWCRAMWSIIGSYLEEQYDANIFFLVDWDYDGISIWKTKIIDWYVNNVDLNVWNDWSIDETTNLYFRKNKDFNYHILLLPVPKHLDAFVFKKQSLEKNENIISSWSVLDNTFKDKSNCSIEDLLVNEITFNEWLYKFNDGHNYFIKEKLPWWTDRLTFNGKGGKGNQKIQFMNNIIENSQLKPLWDNFKPLFEYLKENIILR